MEFSSLAKRVPTFPFRNGPKIPKIAQVGVRSWTSNGTGKAGTHLSLTLTFCVKTFSGASGGQKENKDGFAHSANNCHDLYSQRKNGEREWISAFLEGENARKSLLWQLCILRERICATAVFAGTLDGNKKRSGGDCLQALRVKIWWNGLTIYTTGLIKHIQAP